MAIGLSRVSPIALRSVAIYGTETQTNRNKLKLILANSSCLFMFCPASHCDVIYKLCYTVFNHTSNREFDFIPMPIGRHEVRLPTNHNHNKSSNILNE